MRLFYTIILCLIIFSCGKNKETASESDTLKTSKPDSTKSNENTNFKLEDFLVSEQTDTSKVQIVNYDCAVLILNTKDEIEKMKKAGSEEEFETTIDDANFYLYEARQLIDSVGIKTLASRKQFIKFIGDQKNWTLDTRKKDLAGWNLILFKTNKSPQVAPNISVTLDLAKNYFDKN